MACGHRESHGRVSSGSHIAAWKARTPSPPTLKDDTDMRNIVILVKNGIGFGHIRRGHFASK